MSRKLFTTKIAVDKQPSAKPKIIDSNVENTNEVKEVVIEETDKNTHVLIYCYKGYSSQKIANFLTDSGFINVYSLIGGFNAWKTKVK